MASSPWSVVDVCDSDEDDDVQVRSSVPRERKEEQEQPDVDDVALRRKGHHHGTVEAELQCVICQYAMFKASVDAVLSVNVTLWNLVQGPDDASVRGADDRPGPTVEYPVLKLDETEEANVNIARTIVLDTSDENEDGRVHMRMGLAIQRFPASWNCIMTSKRAS
ncbi:hypothetical protein PsorP6_019318 [Peronosclerospora sorghi]|nr:hypothetical protein PsorP6_019318 [Peronosclerospora sorghi]